MSFRKRGILHAVARFALSAALVGLTPMFPAEALAALQAEQDQLFAQAVKDYNNNRFPDAQAEFEKVQGAHAHEAQQYIAKIKSYNDAIETANDIMRRDADELDLPSVESAIQEYNVAISIKIDGPKMPKHQLQNANKYKDRIEKDLCEKSLAADRKQQYGEAARLSCTLKETDATYSCGGDQVSNLCVKEKALAKVQHPPPPPPTTKTTIAEKTPSDAGSRAGNVTFVDARADYEANNFAAAREEFGQVSGDTKASGDLRSTAKDYLDKISRYQTYMSQAKQLSADSKYEDARLAFANAAKIKGNGPGNPWPSALRMELAEGLNEFYSGNYTAAIQHLDDYVQNSGEKQSLAHFYLGASKAGRTFIGGGEDLPQDAVKDFQDAKRARFKVDPQDISPKILQAYQKVNF
jgi:hypothetical protein